MENVPRIKSNHPEWTGVPARFSGSALSTGAGAPTLFSGKPDAECVYPDSSSERRHRAQMLIARDLNFIRICNSCGPGPIPSEAHFPTPPPHFPTELFNAEHSWLANGNL